METKTKQVSKDLDMTAAQMEARLIEMGCEVIHAVDGQALRDKTAKAEQDLRDHRANEQRMAEERTRYLEWLRNDPVVKLHGKFVGFYTE